ncbi:MAG: hypothetical protein WA823_16655 [Candidatus Acidiferrales bacterium]
MPPSGNDDERAHRLFLRYSIRTSAVVALAVVSLAAAPSAERIHLSPRFVAGETLRYQIETRTSTTGKATSPIVDPEAASKFDQIANLVVRLDVLDVKPDADGATSRVRLRATYEKSDAVLESDSYDPGAAAVQDQYEKLQGRAFQFTIEPDGKVSGVTGIDDVLANPASASAVQSWMNGLASTSKFPREGIAIGQKWTDDRPLDNTPIANLTFHTESTYVRDEDCHSSAIADATESSTLPSSAAWPPPASQGEKVSPALPRSASAPQLASPVEPNVDVCAVILTQFRIFRPGGGHGDATPEAYLHNGLRTSGTWTGTGESLDTISLSTGMVVRSTQTGHQDMDFEIVSAVSGSKMQYKGHVDSQSEIVLLPNESHP